MNDKNSIIDQRPTTNDQRPTTNDPIHVALAVYDPKGTYSQHAGVTITSIFENTKSKVIVHLLHDETLTEDNKRKFIRTAEKYNQTIKFIDVSEYVMQFSDEFIRLSGKYTIGTTYRLFIPEIITDIERIIYLDCDILVGIDIKELWDIDLEDKTLAGAVDFPGQRFNSSICRQKMRIILNGCRPETYINAGVLLINLNRIRKHGSLFQIGTEWILRRGKMALAPDQDALNSIFRNEIKIIDSRFNQNVLKLDMSNCIMHTLWGKAWSSFRGLYSDSMYWKMYLRSAWGENTTPDELIDILNNKAKPKKAQPLKRLKRYFLGVVPIRAVRYVLMDIYYRLRYRFTLLIHRHS